ncbi:FecR domain-containing protein [Aureisphaera galaxeae]|uniref:FecR family protein n=1 Tax=Aureisphaera galaxeae TaxID=1538023 RepID=UPI00234FCA14|nr:FecR domain-containing protein [Aureisphaera galaxeae]MDC8004785.1 FecR domain-containing protein [Aureisphaera galaxeae]
MEKSHLNNEQEVYLAKWMAGEISDAELAEHISEEDFTFYKKLRLGTELLRTPGTDTFSAIQEKITSQQKAKPLPRKYIRWTMAAAASLVMLFAGYWYVMNGDTTISTTFSEQKTIALLDNSEVILNAKTQLSYEERSWENNREVHLDGEAYFKVEKGSTFSVITENGSVQVLGTQFNVKTTLDYFEVTCYEGMVEVRNGGKAKVLLPGMTVRRINGHPLEDGRSSQEQPSWIHGESSFKSVPLTYVLAELENQYSLTFDTKAIDDSARFTGSFGHDNKEVALSTVFNAMRIEYSYNDQKVVVLRPYE